MLGGDVLLGGEESGGISIQGHLPEGDGVLMALLLVEMVAAMEAPLEDLVEDLLREAGPSHYTRVDLRLAAPVSKTRMVERLTHAAPAAIGGVSVTQVNTLDGVKYTLADESWLLIRPSGTEPVLRVYAEAREPGMVEALLAFGRGVADTRG
jgi:phosphomannomutase